MPRCGGNCWRLVGKDVNTSTSRKHGRRGMNYWEITVLAAARLGCNLDYDKLQDLAENHRSLRQIMGIGDWQDEEVDFDWRRIEDNLIKLRPETLKKINDLIVRAGHELEPQGDRVGAWRYVRGGNEHSLSHGVELDRRWVAEDRDAGGGVGGGKGAGGLASARAFAEEGPQAGACRLAGRRVPRARGRTGCKPGYQKLLALAEDLLARARQLLQGVGVSRRTRQR